MSKIEKAMEKAALARQSAANPANDMPRIATEKLAQLHDPKDRAQHFNQVTSKSQLLVNLNAPYSIGAEEFRKVKSFLLKETKSDGFSNSIMITSALPGEGKTVSSLNLAISLAEEFDHTVLLIEADLRRPTMQNYLDLGTENRPGLSECLLGEADIRDAIIPTGIGKLSIIRAGRSVSNPAELFSSQRMKTMLDELKSRYHDRYIIFDTPPILPFTEARSLAHMVDGTIFVLKERQATSSDIREALDILKDCNILGMIYNNAEQLTVDKRYSYYSHYMKNITAGQVAEPQEQG